MAGGVHHSMVEVRTFLDLTALADGLIATGGYENGQGTEHEDEAPHKTALDRLVLCDKPDATLELFIWELTRRVYAVCP